MEADESTKPPMMIDQAIETLARFEVNTQLVHLNCHLLGLVDGSDSLTAFGAHVLTFLAQLLPDSGELAQPVMSRIAKVVPCGWSTTKEIPNLAVVHVPAEQSGGRPSMQVGIGIEPAPGHRPSGGEGVEK